MNRDGSRTVLANWPLRSQVIGRAYCLKCTIRFQKRVEFVLLTLLNSGEHRYRTP